MAFYVHKCAFLKHDLSIPRVLTRPRASHPNTKAAGCGSSVSSTNPTMSCKLRNIPPSFQIKGGSCLSVSILVTKLWPQAVIFDSIQFYFEIKYMFVPSLISLPFKLTKTLVVFHNSTVPTHYTFTVLKITTGKKEICGAQWRQQFNTFFFPLREAAIPTLSYLFPTRFQHRAVVRFEKT